MKILITLLIGSLLSCTSNKVISAQNIPNEKTEKKVEEKITEKSSTKPAKEILTHNYKAGQPSVVISEWKNHKRTYTFYNLNGDITYSLEEVRLSYSVRVSLDFHSNGAVKKIVENTNPGGSMYMTSATTTMSNDNIPQWKTVESIPAKDDFLQNGNPTYYWNKEAKKWIKQEVVEEQAVPDKSK